jgi:hypothetical protein
VGSRGDSRIIGTGVATAAAERRRLRTRAIALPSLRSLLCFHVGNSRVANMETYGSIGADEASAALASVRRSRTRVAWSGYPAWYWLVTGAGLSVGTVAILLPDWWGLAVVVVVTVGLVRVAHAASRARGVCEGWIRGAMTWRDGVVLYGPATVVILANAVVSRFALWWPWSSIVAAVLVFLLFAGTGFTLSARAARQ